MIEKKKKIPSTKQPNQLVKICHSTQHLFFLINRCVAAAAATNEMFKRLTKARRHSADEIAGGTGVLPNPLTLDEPPGGDGGGCRKNSTDAQPTSYVFGSSRSKFTRKSCGDAYTLLQATEEDPDEISITAKITDTETDYRVVTAVPAYIVEHEPEKQKGLFKIKSKFFFFLYTIAVKIYFRKFKVIKKIR